MDGNSNVEGEIVQSKSGAEIINGAMEMTWDKLRQVRKTSAEDLQRVATDYIAYLHELMIYDAKHRGGGNLARWTAGGYEQRLIRAQQGDYSEVKRYFRDHGIVAASSEDSTREQKEMGKLCMIVSAKIPDHGSQYRPPKPALLDPSFNPALQKTESR